jgi:hypothetical protein
LQQLCNDPLTLCTEGEVTSAERLSMCNSCLARLMDGAVGQLTANKRLL